MRYFWRNVFIALSVTFFVSHVAVAQDYEPTDACYYDADYTVGRSDRLSPDPAAKKFRDFLATLPSNNGGADALNRQENFPAIREYIDENWERDFVSAGMRAFAISLGCYGYSPDAAAGQIADQKAVELGSPSSIAYRAVRTFSESDGKNRSTVKRELREAITQLQRMPAWAYLNSEIEALEGFYLLVDLNPQLMRGRARPEKITETCQRFARARDLWSRNGFAHFGLSNCYRYTAGWRQDLTMAYAHRLAYEWIFRAQSDTNTFDLERQLADVDKVAEAQELAYRLTDRTWPNEKAAGNGGSSAQTPDPADSQMTLASSGSAFFISEFLLATNAHVVADARLIKVVKGGKEQVAELVVTDPDLDLAILKLDEPLKGPWACFSIEKAGMSPPGTRIYAVGFPYSGLLSSDAKITEGVVSSNNGLGGDTKTFQISAALQPGNSGGPVFDASGKLVGIAVSKLKFGQNVNFAIKPIYLQALLESVGAEARCQSEFSPIGDSPAGFETTLALVANYQ